MHPQPLGMSPSLMLATHASMRACHQAERQQRHAPVTRNRPVTDQHDVDNTFECIPAACNPLLLESAFLGFHWERIWSVFGQHYVETRLQF